MSPVTGDVQWFPAEIRKLILAIKKHELLYNPRHAGFGLRDLVSKAWKAVANTVGGDKTDTQCRDKWNCLRGTYRRHVRTEMTNNVKRRSGWPWADMMSFIRKYVMDKDELTQLLEAHAGTKRVKTKSPPPLQPPMLPSQVQKPMLLAKPHQLNCPARSSKQIATVALSSANTITTDSNLSFTNTIYNGSLILNRVGIGIVQPSQSIGIVQPNQNMVIHQNIVQSNQQNVTMGIVQPNKTVGIKLIQSSQAMNVTRPSQTINALPTNETKDVNTSSANPLQVDLSKVKPDPDQPSESPATTEFVDMKTMVKKEPMDEDEDDMEEFSFFPEDTASQGSVFNEQQEEEKSEQQDQNVIEESQTQQTSKQPKSPDRQKEKDKRVNDLEDEINASNQLFMRSIVEHMRHLSAYDQSVFKLKVQQLLHEMMFPARSRPTN